MFCRVLSLACAVSLALLCVLCVGCGTQEAAVTEPQTQAIPKVVGLTESGARAVLEREGFAEGTVTTQAVETTKAATLFAGTDATVISQDPTAGVQSKTGSTVDIVIGVPAQPIRVLDLVGGTESWARLAVRHAGLYPEVIYVKDDAASGTIVDQEPAAGELVPVDTVVKVYVAK